MPYSSILVPTDGSKHAQRATAHALSLASIVGAEVHALGVVDVSAAGGPFDAGGVETSFVDRLQEYAEESVQHVENQWAQPDRFHREIREGRPSETILEYIDEKGIDMVAMGTHGRTGLRRFVLGSVTEHVIRKSPIPVLTTSVTESEPPTLPYRNILIPTDGSECASDAVDHAIELAAACGGTLHALNVVEDTVTTGPEVGIPSEYLTELEASGEDAIAEISDRAGQAGVETTTAVRRGRASDEIKGYARENDIDLVVMGTHGRSGLDRVLLGSTTERVIRRSERAVLAVPARESEE